MGHLLYILNSLKNGGLRLNQLTLNESIWLSQETITFFLSSHLGKAVRCGYPETAWAESPLGVQWKKMCLPSSN